MQKLEALDNAHQELLAKQTDESRSSIAFGNELAELEGDDNAMTKDEKIDELQEELTNALAQNQRLAEEMSNERSQLQNKISELEQQLEDKQFELSSIEDKL